MTRNPILRFGFVSFLVFGTADLVRADEGMWLFTAPPVKQLEEKYEFEPTSEWLEHIQKSCVRMGQDGSGSFVSSNGLLMTSHRVGSDQLEKLGTSQRDLLETGFYARTKEEELKCPDFEVQALWSVADVTGFVLRGVKADMKPSDKYYVTRARMAIVAKRAEKATGLHCEVMPLQYGSRYYLYRYRRYTDVRLVMAPERAVAQFGGNPSSFEFPRFSFDVCFFRVYENGEPLQTEHRLPWSESGAADLELVFVAGHPGKSERLLTVGHLKHLRDFEYPLMLDYLRRRVSQLQDFSARSAEHARIARGELTDFQTARMSKTGTLAGLHDPEFFRHRVKKQMALRQSVKDDAKHERLWGEAWNQIASANRTDRRQFPRFMALEGQGTGGGSRLYGMAKHLVRLASELTKFSIQRLPKYQDTNLDSLYQKLYSPAPIHDELEIDRLTSAFSYLAERFGADDPLVTKVCAGKSPRDQAVHLVKGTMLEDIESRKSIADGGPAAIIASTDPLVRLIYDLEIQVWKIRWDHDTDVLAIERDAYSRIAAAQFSLDGGDGDGSYPESDGSLRLAFGPIRGYTEDGQDIPPFTTCTGLFDRHKHEDGLERFALPKRWVDHKDEIDPATPLNFVSTADINGGNSGSPVLNRKGEVVGLVFDRNAHTHTWPFTYDDQRGRAIAVDSRAVMEILRKVYDAGKLADEIAGP